MDVFHDAARNGMLDSLKKIIDANAELDVTDSNGKTALFLAVERGHTACVELLVAAKAGIAVSDNDRKTALMWAAFH